MTDPISSTLWGRAERLRLFLRARRAISALEAPIAARDPFPQVFFGAAFLVYAFVGSEIQRRDAFRAFNYFFNADCPRVIDDMLQSHLKMPSEVVAQAHPLFALFANPPAVVLQTIFRDSGTLPARLLCHAAGAGGVVLAYAIFKALGAPRWLAAAAAACFALSTTEIVLGSVVETFSFVSLFLATGVLVGMRSVSPFRNAAAQVLAFGANSALLPHTLFCAPVLWCGRLSIGRWLRNTLVFFCAALLLIIVLSKLQESLYPGTGFFFQKNSVHLYEAFWSVPKTREAFTHRFARVVPHFFAFDYVAPKPLLTDAPDKITTFMWEQKNTIARYDTVGRFVVVAWLALAGIATLSNIRTLFRGDAIARARIVLLAGWLLGSFGFFMVFGDDLLLYSPFWAFHWGMWIVVGLVPLVSKAKRSPLLRACAVTFVAALAVNNATFVHRMLAHYG